MPNPVSAATSAASTAPSPPGVGAAFPTSDATRNAAPICATLRPAAERLDRGDQREDVRQRGAGRAAEELAHAQRAAEHTRDFADGRTRAP